LRAVPEAAVPRLAVYLRVLGALADSGVNTISSEELANAAGVNSAKLRKDLSYLGSYGTRGVGYETVVLIESLQDALGLTQQQNVAVVGLGNLGHALANYHGFPSRGFPVVALFDVDSDLLDVEFSGLTVNHIADIPQVCKELDVAVGVIATPPPAAQLIANQLVAGGVRSILNFAPVVLNVPSDIEVRKVDLAVEMQILTFHAARRLSSLEEMVI
jgi:redox-sensing transcriptional repressor